MFSNFQVDYESLYTCQTKLLECQFEIKQLLGTLPKISFESDEETLKDNLVGCLSCSFPNTYFLIKSSGTHEIHASTSLSRMQYLKNQDKIVITDSTNKCLKIVDINNGLLIQSAFKSPGESENLFKHPFSICVDSKKNEIFVSDIELSKVFIFNQNLELLRTFCDSIIKIPTSISLDDKSNLYIGDYTNNLISVWESENFDFVEKIEIDSPAYVELSEKHIFVLNTSLCNFEETRKPLNCIFIIDKASPNEILQTIKVENWKNPYGLILKNDYIITVSNETSRYSSVSNCDNLYLYVFNKYGYCVQKTKLNQHEPINDLLIVDGTMFICFKNFVKIFSIQ